MFAINKDRAFNAEIFYGVIILYLFNSAIDPIIYVYRLKDVRDALKGFFCWNLANEPNEPKVVKDQTFAMSNRK